MMKLIPSTIDGNSLNSSIFTSVFTGESGLDAGIPYETLIAGAVTESPQYQGKIAHPRTVVLTVTIVSRTMTNAELLMKWFDPAAGNHTLVATAEGVAAQDTRYLICTVLSRKSVDGADWIWEFVLQAADGRWKYDEANNANNVTVSPTNINVVGNGDTRSSLKIRIKPISAKTAANGWQFRRRIVVANRSSNALICPNGAIGYPIDLFGAAWDHAALVTAGKSLASGDDVRLFVDGTEWPRYASVWNSAATRFWSPLSFSPGRSCEFAMASGTATVASVETLNSVANYPPSGYIVYGSGATPELIWYESHDAYHFYNLHRGMWGTTVSAWLSSVTSWFVEHDIQVIYGYTGSGAAPIASTISDFTPIIDLVNSTNVLHKFTTTFWNRATRKARQFVSSYKEANILDKNTSLADAVGPSFRDTPGLFKKNVLTLDCPVEIATSASAIEHDISIGGPNHVVLVKGLDTIGNDETTLATYYRGQDGANKVITPASAISSLSYEIHQLLLTGANAADYAFTTITSTSYRAQTFTLDKDSTIEAISIRVKRPSGSDTLLVDLVKAYPESGTDPSYIDATITYMAQATITPVGTTAEWDTIDLTASPIKLKAGLYALLFRSAGTTGVQVAHSNGSVISGGEGKTGVIGQVTFSIDADFDAYATTGVGGSTSSTTLKFGGTPHSRSFWRVPLAGLPVASARTVWANPRITCKVTTAPSTTTGHIYAYVTSGFTNYGQDDPEVDYAVGYQTMYDKESPLACTTGVAPSWYPTGVKTVYLDAAGSFGQTWLPNAKANVNRFTFCLQGDTVASEMEAIENAGTENFKFLMEVTEQANACFSTNEGWDYGFRIFGSVDDTPQVDAPAGDGTSTTILNLDINMTPAKAPLIYATTEATGIYLLYGVRINNTTSAQYFDITLPMSLNDEIEIDCLAKTARWLTAGGVNASGVGTSCVIGESVIQAIDFLDEAEWMRIEPGLAQANVVSVTDTGIGTLVVTFIPTSMWS